MEEYYQFLTLPRDVIKLFMLKYFDPVSALRCLQVCKYFKNILSLFEIEMVKVRVVKLITWEEQAVWIETLDVQCELCGAEFKKESMARHLRKHEKRIKQGKDIQRVRPNLEDPTICRFCNVLYAECGPHGKKGCPLQIISCDNHKYLDYYRWSIIVCAFKTQGYRKQVSHHDCSFRCNYCKKLFKLDVSIISRDNGFYRHLRSCEFKMEIITLWGISLPII